jgi:hypothetical protein
MTYKNKSLPQLKHIAQKHHNKYIRERDKGKPCISCNTSNVTDAGHYIAVGSCDALRYEEYNTHGQCGSCNRFKGGNQINYRFGLLNRIGQEKLEKLEMKYQYFKSHLHKFNRFTLLDIIETRKAQLKELNKSFIL